MKSKPVLNGIINQQRLTIQQLQADNERLKEDCDFLLRRSAKAGSCSFRADRDTGASSNSIVLIAYQLSSLADQIFPRDESDLNACRRMWEQLPEHRKTKDAKKAFGIAKQALKLPPNPKGN